MTFRVAAIAVAVLLVLLPGGAIGGVRFGLIPDPFKPSAAQIADLVEPSLVTVKADQFRAGSVSGSGFAYAQSDHVLISARLLTHAVAITASDRSGKSFVADALGIDTAAGVAEIELSGFGGAPLKRADQEPSVGADVYVPHASSGSLAKGVVTGQDHGLIQTDVPADLADSGEPMVDGNGAVVGLVEMDGGGHAAAIPASSFDAKAKAWATANAPVAIGPPLVTATAQSLVLSSPGAGWKQVAGAAYDNDTAWHSAWVRDPTYKYGGMAVDINVVVFGTTTAAVPEYPSQLANADRNGFTNAGPLTGFGDEGALLQSTPKGEVVYELVWRDRNCVVVLYLSAATPPPPEFSLAAAMSLATAQEKPIGAGLASY